MKAIRLLSAALTLALTLAGCGGGGGGAAPPVPPPPPPPPPPITKAESFQFLNQTTFGATEAAATQVIAMGYEAWIDDQLTKPASLQLPFLQNLQATDPKPFFERHPDRVDIWFRNALNGDDQLRQRVAFALSEIFVISQLGATFDVPYGMADFYDVLAENAFGNYRELIEEVTRCIRPWVSISACWAMRNPIPALEHSARRKLRTRTDATVLNWPGRAQQ